MKVQILFVTLLYYVTSIEAWNALQTRETPNFPSHDPEYLATLSALNAEPDEDNSKGFGRFFSWAREKWCLYKRERCYKPCVHFKCQLDCFQRYRCKRKLERM